MARATNLYLLVPQSGNLGHAEGFTVKHEAKTWAINKLSFDARHKWVLWRFPDGLHTHSNAKMMGTCAQLAMGEI